MRDSPLFVSCCFENSGGPRGGVFRLGCVTRLMALSTVLAVSYCRLGDSSPKRTTPVLSPEMRFPWATRLDDWPGLFLSLVLALPALRLHEPA